MPPLLLTQLFTISVFIAHSIGAPSPQPQPRGVLDGITIPITGGTYDYIVIGAGTAGATLAARLAEDPSIQAAVIEAVDDLQDLNPLVFIPGADVLGVGADSSDTQLNNDWAFVTQPQAGTANRSIHHARGKGVGGTSLKIFMIYQRPSSDSFSTWEDATSGQATPGWGWPPYFTKSVTITAADASHRGPGQDARFNPAAYPESDTSKAPLTLGYPIFAFNYSRTLQEAFAELQYPEASDFSSGTLNGVNFAPATINPQDGHHATKMINFDANLNAVLVTYTTLGNLVTTTIGASKEIILSAGAFQSPQILMASGVGPTAQLSQFGPGYEIDPDIYGLGKESRLLTLLSAGADFLFNNSGSLTNNVADFLGWQRLNDNFFGAHPEASNLSSYPPLWSHLEFLAGAGLTSNFFNLLMLNSIPATTENNYFYSLLGVLVAPLSRGTVTLASSNTNIKPLIDPGWLTHPDDQAVAVELHKKIRRIFDTQAFKSVRVNVQEYYPGYDMSSDADILEAIQASVQTVWHAACTCAMQPRDKNGVLDPYLRVYDVNRLRVVDASSFPTLLPGYPQSFVYMIAERAADFIKTANGANITTTPRSPVSSDSGVPYSGPN